MTSCCFPASPASLFWPANPRLSQREIHKRWICSCTHHSSSFTGQTQASIHPHPPAQHFNPARTNREIKKLKLRHDERRVTAVRRMWAGEEGRQTCRVEVFNQHRPTSLLPGTWCCFLQRGGETGGKSRVQHLLFILLNSATYLSPSFLCFQGEKKHSLDSMSVWSLQGNQSHQMSIHEDELHLSRKHSKYFCICAGHGGIVEAFALLSVTKSHFRLKPMVCRSVG